MKNEIILYSPDELAEHIEVRIDEETVWLNRQQISNLFNRDVKTIGKHINNVFSEGELDEKATVAKFATVQNEGDRTVERRVEYYNLDVIISVGYRVKSKQGTQFRIWANRILKDYLLKGYSLNNRMNRIEDNIQALNEKVDRIDLQINTSLPPVQGVFFNGQIFDSYNFVADLVRSAKRSIELIDNYIDDSVLVLLEKRNSGVTACIFTQNIGKQLKLDIEKHNAQYPAIEVKHFKDAHDRFLIIDNSKVYHIGASIKDLGKKLFAFSLIENKEIITNLIKNL
jgi:hypothetical protein